MTATIAVLGPGAIGGALAVHLDRAGARVICIGRGKTAAAINADGLTLEAGGSELRARPAAVEALEERVDVLLVTVKATGLRGALDRVPRSREVGAVVPLLNGLEHLDVLRERLDAPVVAGSISGLEAFRRAPTRIVQTTPTPVVTVSSPATLPGVKVRVVPGDRAVLWDKAARLAPLAAATAVTQRPVGDLRADPTWRQRLEQAIEEACAVAVADGVDLDAAAQWAIIESMPPTLTTSTARDVAANRPSELDAIVGSVVRAAQRLAVRAPTLEWLFEEAEARCRALSR